MRPELGLLQLTPRPVVGAIVRPLVPGATTAGRRPASTSSCAPSSPPRGRAAFYAAARQIYLEEPEGEKGFWTRLRGLRARSLFVWGRKDRLVPIGFARHVSEAAAAARATWSSTAATCLSSSARARRTER